MIEKLKGALKSKTIYLGLALSVFGLVQANLQLFTPMMSDKAAGWFAFIIGLIVIVLRWITTEALNDK